MFIRRRPIRYRPHLAIGRRGPRFSFFEIRREVFETSTASLAVVRDLGRFRENSASTKTETARASRVINKSNLVQFPKKRG